jgi:anthraniloyl-CoA monooxygenase
MTSPLPEGRITPGCPGLWNDTQQAAFARIVDSVHQHSSARIGLRLGHSGPKGSTQLGWEGSDEPLPNAQGHPAALFKAAGCNLIDVSSG